MFALAPHAFLDRPLLVNDLSILVLFAQILQLGQIQKLGSGGDQEEELVIDEDNSLAAFLYKKRGTTIGRRLVLTFEK